MKLRMTQSRLTILAAALLVGIGATALRAADPWVQYAGGEGTRSGKKIVLVSGDEEYRSEEALPQLAKILAKRHGFDCTVLFAINPRTGLIDGNHQQNIPGLEALDDADLMILFTRFRRLPEEQMQHIDAYLESGGPVIGIRTSTHAFLFPQDASSWKHYSNDYDGPLQEWRGGFGRLVLGEKWISHHGEHKRESTRGIIAPGAAQHPIARGLTDGDVWGSTDVYGVRLPLPGDSQPIILGQVMERRGAYDEDDVHYGMRPEDDQPAGDEKNDPMMPVVWTKSYQLPDGESGRALMSTIGASGDLLSEGTRRMLVNAVYWALGMDDQLPAAGANVDLVGSYNPSQFGFKGDQYWLDKSLRPEDFADPADR